ncbi:MAG TPA: Rid family detoxifying hydrolase, partial [Candidatus Latescibacteria bacterium]|nr:Rid family detoxifying hydrolase [Candidatus Latescibacterota bacterium]
MRELVETSKAPRPIAPYCQAVKANGFVFVSGQGPLDPATGQIVQGTIEEQTRLTIETIKAILEAAGTSLENVVKVGVFLQDMKDFRAMNRIYGEYFG